MVAAAATLWVTFSIWLIAPHARLPRRYGKAASVLLLVELVALMLWSYGSENCGPDGCSALSQAAGGAARLDIPLLAALFVVVAAVRLWRRAPARA